MNSIITRKALIYSSLCIALATILSTVKLFEMPMGGTVTACSMLFIALSGYWFGTFTGVLTGVLTGVVYGFLQLALGAVVVHPIQLLLDYPVAFGLLGLSGLFKDKYLIPGYVLGACGRFAASVISGFVFFSEYAGDSHPVMYSLLYNMSYILPEIIITVVLVSVPSFKHVIKKVALSNR